MSESTSPRPAGFDISRLQLKMTDFSRNQSTAFISQMFGVVHRRISLLAPRSKLSSCTITVLLSMTVDFAPKTDTCNGQLSVSRPSTSTISSFRPDEPEPQSRKALALILTPFFPCRITGTICRATLPGHYTLTHSSIIP